MEPVTGEEARAYVEHELECNTRICGERWAHTWVRTTAEGQALLSQVMREDRERATS